LIPIFFFRVTTTTVRPHLTLGAICSSTLPLSVSYHQLCPPPSHKTQYWRCTIVLSSLPPTFLPSISVPFHPNPPMAAVSGPDPLTHFAPFRKAQKFFRPPATTTAHGPSDSVSTYHYIFILTSYAFANAGCSFCLAPFCLSGCPPSICTAFYHSNSTARPFHRLRLAPHAAFSSRTFLLVRTSSLHLHRLLPLKLHG